MKFIFSFIFTLIANSILIGQNNKVFTIAIGSCNKQDIENKLWKPILQNNPDVWVWGGDNVYSDTEDMNKRKKDYGDVLLNAGYQSLKKNTPILATWDDHDYGLDDGGKEYVKRKEAQQLFLDFLGVSKESVRRKQEGIYHAETFTTTKGSVKIIILDTRYFRTSLTISAKKDKRYQPNTYGKGTMLGKAQWLWLEKELKNSKADFNIITSSIQFLSYKHGFEAWGTFPHEVDKLKKMIATSKAKNVIITSGDRHISEFSSTPIKDIDYPLIDFTSSGLTHSYEGFTKEENPNRIGKVVHVISFGLIKINFEKKSVTFQMRGENNILLQELTQSYH